MTSILSKGVKKNTPNLNILQTNTAHHSPGVRLSSKKVIPHSAITKQRIIIGKNTPKMIKISSLYRGYIKSLIIENIHSIPGDTLYTIGTNIDTFTPLCEPRTLYELKNNLVNIYIPVDCDLVCNIKTKNDEKNTDTGSIILTIAVTYNIIVSK
jgi:hypothetical protein